VKAKGMTIFARIDHAAGATEVGLRPLAPFANARSAKKVDQGSTRSSVAVDVSLWRSRLMLLASWRADGDTLQVSTAPSCLLQFTHGTDNEFGLDGYELVTLLHDVG
jgi:hypothetical protein